MEKTLDVMDLTIDGIKYPEFKLHQRIDLRTALNSNWKLLQGYPRVATENELEAYAIPQEEVQGQLVQVYRYMNLNDDVTITQIFTHHHKYLGGGEHFRLLDERIAMSDEDLLRISNVAQF